MATAADGRLLTVVVALALVAALGVAAVNVLSRPVPGAPRVFLGVDRTLSFQLAVGADLQNDLRRVLHVCAESSCHLAMDGLSDDTLGHSRVPFSKQLKLPDGLADATADVRAAAIDTTVASSLPQVTSSLGLVGANCTDVVSAFVLARQVLASLPGDGPRFIVVGTDGFSTCGGDVAHAAETAQGISALIGALRRRGLVPDLHGVTVRFFGAGRTSLAAAPGTSERLRLFWRAYLAATSATLPPDWWSTRFLATSFGQRS